MVPAVVIAAIPAVVVAVVVAARALAVVAFTIDLPAFAIEHAVEPLAFARGHDAVGAGARLGAVDALFTLLEARSFAPCE